MQNINKYIGSIFGQIFEQVFGQVFDKAFGQIPEQGFWTRQYSVRIYQDEEHPGKQQLYKISNEYVSRYPTYLLTGVCSNVLHPVQLFFNKEACPISGDLGGICGGYLEDMWMNVGGQLQENWGKLRGYQK